MDEEKQKPGVQIPVNEPQETPSAPEVPVVAEEQPAVVPEQGAATVETAEAPEQPVEQPAAAVQPVVAAKQSFFARHKRWVIVAAVLVLAVAAGVAYWATRPDSSTETTTKSSKTKVAALGVAPTLIDGTVEYSRDAKTWTELTDKVDLQEGYSVRTGSNGRVVLTLDDGSAVRLGYDSIVKLASLATKDVHVETVAGEVYSRVITSTSRTFTVAVEDVDMVAKGTAFRTMNNDRQKGVEVYQSTVAVKDTDVTEGKAYFTEHGDANKQEKVSDIDLTALKSDEFIKWNVDQDKQMSEAKDKLGVLKDIDKPAETTATTTQTQSNGLVLSGALSGYTGKFTWKVTGVDVSKGFKLVMSKSTKTPVYPGNDYQYYSSSSARSATWDLDGSKTYYFRVCAYRGDSCDSYSNTVTLTTPAKSDDSGSSDLVHGSLTLNISGTTLSWSMTGTAPNGYKVVRNTTGSPVYPGSDYLYFSSASTTSADVTSLSLESGVNYIRVCKYTGGGCTDYSNQVTYTKP